MTDTENTKSYRDIQLLQATVRSKLGSLYVISYPEIIDALHWPKAVQDLELIAEKTEEPILLTMGSVEILYLPATDTTRRIFGITLDSPIWIKPIDIDTMCVLDSNELDFRQLFSAAAYESPLYTMECLCGLVRDNFDLRMMNFHMLTGEVINTQFNDKIVTARNGRLLEKKAELRRPDFTPRSEYERLLT